MFLPEFCLLIEVISMVLILALLKLLIAEVFLAISHQ